MIVPTNARDTSAWKRTNKEKHFCSKQRTNNFSIKHRDEAFVLGRKQKALGGRRGVKQYAPDESGARSFEAYKKQTFSEKRFRCRAMDIHYDELVGHNHPFESRYYLWRPNLSLFIAFCNKRATSTSHGVMNSRGTLFTVNVCLLYVRHKSWLREGRQRVLSGPKATVFFAFHNAKKKLWRAARKNFLLDSWYVSRCVN